MRTITCNKTKIITSSLTRVIDLKLQLKTYVFVKNNNY